MKFSRYIMIILPAKNNYFLHRKFCLDHTVLYKLYSTDDEEMMNDDINLLPMALGNCNWC